MADPADAETPRLSPMAPPDVRAEFVRELKAQLEAGEYCVSPDDLAAALVAQFEAARLSQ